MSLPPKSRYSISEAASYLTSALSESVTTGQVLDWGAQDLYKLYLSIGHATVRQGEKVSHINDCLVEIRPTAEQAAQLSRGAKITIVDCWREGDKYEFVRSRPGEYGGGHTRNTLYVAVAAVAVAGLELQAFIAGISTTTVEALIPAEQAPGTKAAPGAPSQAKNWQEHAREIGDVFFDNDTNATPPVRDSLLRMLSGKVVGGYAVRVMDEMAKQKIHGPRGVITNPATIAREALSGSKWWAKKPK